MVCGIGLLRNINGLTTVYDQDRSYIPECQIVFNVRTGAQ